jgi:hypothetical protein
MKLPSIADFYQMFPNDNTCFKFLAAEGVFYDSLPCPGCNKPMKRNEDKSVFRCTTNSCNQREISMRKHTFFFDTSLSCRAIMFMALLWLAGVGHLSVIELTHHSPNTVSNFFKYFRQLISSNLTVEECMIGGPDVIVEIDETKLGKRKYNKGHRVDGVWILCGIERTIEANAFCVPLKNRSAETLENIITKHVKEGSIIYTDKWKGYDGLKENLGLEHMTVNHSVCFKEPVTGVCTNKVEGLNNGLKLKVKARNRVRNGIEGHLGEFIWRKRNKECLWSAFIIALRDIHYE